ncbi:MAG TPA: response regulator [Desulfuromonadales bacterium]|nr:response regulator [Desulfuromonadales bacterium]
MDNEAAAKKKVLIVDDEPLSVKILCHQIEDDYSVILARSGREALDIISHTAPDIILLDLLMPEMDGYEVYRAIRKIQKLDCVPVLFITSLPDTECEAMGLELGANDFVHKPFIAELVRLRIKNHLTFSQERSLLLKRGNELQALNAKLEAEIDKRKEIQRANEELIIKLEKALEQVKQLEGIIPICSYCHKIRDDRNVWQQMEQYISSHSEAMFSHGACPECAAKVIGEMKVHH